ncbi:MAG: type II restriction endonuclease [Verrucomicrobiales bacterium]|nr:type II restriction endonuclease [Verrucomicrobiales bacterium]
MIDKRELRYSEPQNDTNLLLALLEKTDRIFVKKLSNNDRDWARFENKHQAGIYITREHRDGGFFPVLIAKVRDDPNSDEIRESFFTITWPQLDLQPRDTRLVHYTSKGQETHLTRLPKSLFANLLPASYVVMGRIQCVPTSAYECLTINSGSEDAVYLSELLNIGPDFLVGEYDPSAAIEVEQGLVLDFAERVIAAWLEGEIGSFAAANASMPNTVELAKMARDQYLDEQTIKELNPFQIQAPGDALREISRGIEWNLFREFQRRERAVALVRIIMGDSPVRCDAAQVIRRLVDELPKIDRLMLSASQQRKSRAGYSYEHHIGEMLMGGGVPFEQQVPIGHQKRPDFVLPSLKFLNEKHTVADAGLILSAKTTLRERWKQVEREKGRHALYLTTVDENIASSTIKDMASFGVRLVIPEGLKDSKEAEYAGHENVLSFREFCDAIIEPRIAAWT